MKTLDSRHFLGLSIDCLGATLRAITMGDLFKMAPDADWVWARMEYRESLRYFVMAFALAIEEDCDRLGLERLVPKPKPERDISVN